MKIKDGGAMRRAYTTLEIKSTTAADGKRIFTGIASTISTDRMGDIVEPDGAIFKLPIPLLWQHDTRQPIGWVTAAKVTKQAIEITGEVAVIGTPGELANRLTYAWQSIDAKLVRGLSIRFDPIEHSQIDGTWGFRFTKWEWLELSVVTIPANSDATIQSIKAIDNNLRAALGMKDAKTVVRLQPAGASASPKPKPPEGKMDIAKQIQNFEASRAAKAAVMKNIMDKSGESGSTLDAAQTEEYDGAAREVSAIDEHLKRLRDYQKSQAASAVPVDVTTINTIERGAQAAGGQIVVLRKEVPKGTAFGRYVQALCVGKGNLMQACEFAKRFDDSTPEVGLVLKAAVAAGTTTDAAWAAPLVPYQQMTGEFIELLRPATILGRIKGLRHVPFNIKMPTQTGGSTIGWVGQAAPKPVSALAFSNLTLDFTKTAGIVVISDELARLSTPAAEALIRQDMVDQTAQFIDQQFIDPAVAAVAGVNPASITNGATNFAASGITSAAAEADITKLFNVFTAGNISTAGAYFIMREVQLTQLMMMKNALGQLEWPGLQGPNPTWFGYPVVTSETVTATTVGSPPVTTSLIVLIKPSEILLADDGGVTIDVSREASLQMDSAPTNPPVAATVMLSLWQNNLIGIRAERWINWKRRRAAAVAYITGANYHD